MNENHLKNWSRLFKSLIALCIGLNCDLDHSNAYGSDINTPHPSGLNILKPEKQLISNPKGKDPRLQFTHSETSSTQETRHFKEPEHPHPKVTTKVSPSPYEKLVKDQVSIELNGKKYLIEHRSTYKDDYLTHQNFIFGSCIHMGTIEPGREAYLGNLKLSQTSECRKQLSESGKAAESALNLSCAIAKKFGKTKIILEDAARLPLAESPNSDEHQFDASIYLLFTTGKTFYEKYKFKPILNEDSSRILTPDYKNINTLRNMTYSEFYNHLTPTKKRDSDRLIQDLNLGNLDHLLVKDVYQLIIDRAEDADQLDIWQNNLLDIEKLKKLDHVSTHYVREC